MSYGTSQGPAGRIRGPVGQARAPQDELGPVGRIRPRGTNLGQDDQDTGTDRAPRDEPGPRRTNQSLLDTIRALVDEPEPR